MSGIKEDCYWYDYWQDMNARIPFCKLQKADEYLETCEGCEKYHSKHKPTNADRIRAMSDEELAEWISDTMDCSECEHRYAGEGKPCHNGICCPDYWLDWLKQEAKE